MSATISIISGVFTSLIPTKSFGLAEIWRITVFGFVYLILFALYKIIFVYILGPDFKRPVSQEVKRAQRLLDEYQVLLEKDLDYKNESDTDLNKLRSILKISTKLKFQELSATVNELVLLLRNNPNSFTPLEKKTIDGLRRIIGSQESIRTDDMI